MPTIAVFGAGPGLGRSIALRYARDGHDVVLVARREAPLSALADEVRAHGVAAHAIPADLSDLAGIPDLAARVRAAAGDPDVIYYAPTVADAGFVPASQLTVEIVEQSTRVFFAAFVGLVREFLPHLLEQGSGAILTAQGATALSAPAGMSGPGPAMAAQRNWLQSLEPEVAERGVFVGRLYVAALITGSAADQALRGRGGDAPGWPVVDPDDLADALWQLHHDGGPHEAVIPEDNPFTA